jgi:hypothetical protein
LLCEGTFNNGDTNSSTAGTLQMELGGTATDRYDRITVDGTLVATGTLAVAYIDSFTPRAGYTFKLFDATTISGTFTDISLPAVTYPKYWDTSKLYTTGELKLNVPTGTLISVR